MVIMSTQKHTRIPYKPVRDGAISDFIRSKYQRDQLSTILSQMSKVTRYT